MSRFSRKSCYTKDDSNILVRDIAEMDPHNPFFFSYDQITD